MLELELFPFANSNKIILDLFQAYFDARKNKRNTINALAFEKHLETNLFALADEIMNRNYKPRGCICFIINKPVKREIFAADFRDRVVHHFIYQYISPIFEKTFINDSYSCRIGKGTHYGIRRIDHFIRACSRNYTKDCYILKLDIQGYFMSICKPLLYEKIHKVLIRNSNKIDFDLDLVLYLLKVTIFTNPKMHCRIKGSKNDWEGLPLTKSLFHVQPHYGLPIGNLTSQLFGNVYLNEFDHFIKRDLKIKYYGRYVDDLILIHPDKAYLQYCITEIRYYLKKELQLILHPDKIYLQHYSKGVKYLGTVIKPHRIYIANRSKGNFYTAITKHNKVVRDHKPTKEEMTAFQSSMNSYLGLMKHYKTYRLRKTFIYNILSAWWLNRFYPFKYEIFKPKQKSVRLVPLPNRDKWDKWNTPGTLYLL
ncbi:MAG TPA: RNA-directed DNA polymerase [Bacteroidales bacterium]|nr:RNA-directed DNA polymerase [Bacteroidales bacterium]